MSINGLKHIQIGAGALALGLIVPKIHSAGVGSIVVNRAPQAGSTTPIRYSLLKDKKAYSLRIGRNSLDPINITITDFHYFTETLASGMLSSPELLITTAVTPSGFIGIVPYLTSLLKKRKAEVSNSSLTYIIACENIRDNSQKLKSTLLDYVKSEPSSVDLEGFINSQCVFLNTVVDRICKLVDGYTSDKVIVDTEPYCQWIVDKSDLFAVSGSTGLLTALGNSIKFVSRTEFNFYERRKTWFVNGGHLALAAYAYSKGEERLDRAIRKPTISANLDFVFQIFSFALQYYARSIGLAGQPDTDEGAISQYSRDVKTRFQESSDTVARIMKDLVKSDYIASEMKKLRTEIENSRLDDSVVRSVMDRFIDFLDIRQFTEKLISRIIDANQILRNYDVNSGGLVLRDYPNLNAEVAHFYELCLLLINKEFQTTTDTLRRLLRQ